LADDEATAEVILRREECAWIGRDLEAKAQAHAMANVVPEHLAEVRDRNELPPKWWTPLLSSFWSRKVCVLWVRHVVNIRMNLSGRLWSF
jgi:hypothetical protein